MVTESALKNPHTMPAEAVQKNPELFLDELDVGVTEMIVVMVCRMWDVNTITGRYLSTDFVVSDVKGNIMHCTTKGNIAHNFIRLKEGGIYPVKNFAVQPNKDEFCILKIDAFMLEFDGATTVRKAFVKADGFVKYPFQLVDVDNLEPTNNTYLIDRLLCVPYKLYLSSNSSTLILDDDEIPVVKELKVENRLRLELEIFDETAKAVVVMFDETATTLNGNSFKPATKITTNADGTSTTLVPGPVTTKKKVQKKNDMKARIMLLMALPNEHLMTFNQYKDAKTLFAAIQIRFGGNEATKKTQKTLLKQMYENFSTPSTESLDSIFNRLQKIVSQLDILGENILQEDLNLKFLRSLPSEWNTHVVVWRNKPDLDTMSFDDLYNNFKIVEQEVKGTASSSSSSSSQNMAFVSSPSSTNEVNTAYGVSTANTQVSPASTQVSTASTQVSTANLSDDTIYAFLASQPNGSQLVYEDLEQIHEDDIEEMDLKWQLALLSMRTRSGTNNLGVK
ncbi:ribonuclease H-like domain-containing protein [Tanacetum coccineum]